MSYTVDNPKRHPWAHQHDFMRNSRGRKEYGEFGFWLFVFSFGGLIAGFVVAMIADAAFVNGPGMSSKTEMTGQQAFWWVASVMMLGWAALSWAFIYQPLRYAHAKFNSHSLSVAYEKFIKLSDEDKSLARPAYTALENVVNDDYVTRHELDTAERLFNDITYKINQLHRAEADRERALYVKSTDPHLEEAQRTLESLDAQLDSVHKDIETLKEIDR